MIIIYYLYVYLFYTICAKPVGRVITNKHRAPTVCSYHFLIDSIYYSLLVINYCK